MRKKIVAGKDIVTQERPSHSASWPSCVITIERHTSRRGRRWFWRPFQEQGVSKSDKLKEYIDAFNDLTSKVKPLQVIFRKRVGRALSVDIAEGGKDNRQLNVILSYLDANPQL